MIFSLCNKYTHTHIQEIEFEGDVIAICYHIKNSYILELHCGDCILRGTFNRRFGMETYLREIGINKIQYHSSNGDIINKILEVDEESYKYVKEK